MMKVTSALLGTIFVGLILQGAPSFAQIAINQAGADYKPIDQSACGAGTCWSLLDPASVINLGNAATGQLASDLNAQFAGWTVAGPGALAGTINVNSYEALNGQYQGTGPNPISGGQIQLQYASPNLPANAHWIQVVTDNDNITGYTDINGSIAAVQTGPGHSENVIDLLPPGASPYYDVSAPTSVPPVFIDSSRRAEPTAANPTIDWSAQLFLVSQTPGANAVTVYAGLQWGWSAIYSAALAPAVPANPAIKTYDVDARGTTLWGLLVVTGTFNSAGDYDFVVDEGGPGGLVYTFTNATGLTQASQDPPPVCIFQPCDVSGPLTATLAPTGDPDSGFISFGFEDSGETFSASGLLDPVTPAVPEPSTWVMMMLGFASLGFAGARWKKKTPTSFATA